MTLPERAQPVDARFRRADRAIDRVIEIRASPGWKIASLNACRRPDDRAHHPRRRRRVHSNGGRGLVSAVIRWLQVEAAAGGRRLASAIVQRGTGLITDGRGTDLLQPRAGWVT